MGGRAAYIAVDWGTTNRRAYAVSEEGAVLDSLHDDRGILALSPGAYPAEIAGLRARLGALPIIAVGMVGSNRGWQAAPYVAAPATLAALAAACLEPAPDVRIVPGLPCGTARVPT
ncbi:2-dehydro-3-deoxygalactonokinase [Methylobacterium sp. NMS12]